MRRCVIVGGAAIDNYQKVREFLSDDDYYVYCDSGLYHTDKLGKNPDLIIGDFDSHEKPKTGTETIVLPVEKDDTDTVYAAKECMRRGFTDFLLTGVIGSRLDHTLGNVGLLLMLHHKGKRAVIVDDYSEMQIVSDQPALIGESYAFFSLLAISGTARGISIKNAKYPLEDAQITCDYPYGVSNEVLPGKTAEVSVKEGELLLVKVWRD